MSSKSNTRFIEIGSTNSSFRSTLNVEHISNIRFEQDLQQIDAQYDENGVMTAPPQQMLNGWLVVIHYGETGQTIAFAKEEQAVELYNEILEMITQVGIPIRKQKKLVAHTHGEQINLFGADGNPLPGEFPELTEEELDALANPEFEIDIDAIADAVDASVGTSDDDDK